MKKFELLKQTFPVSRYERKCDAYQYILDNISEEKRTELGINDDDLQEVIKEGEKYMYRVGKENGKFKYMSISFRNFEILRKYYFLFED